MIVAVGCFHLGVRRLLRFFKQGKLLVDVESSPSTLAMRDLKIGARGSQTFELKLSETTAAKRIAATRRTTAFATTHSARR